MNIETQKKILAYVKLSAALVDALGKQAAAREAEARKAAAAVPATVEALIKHKRIDADDRDEAVTVLRDHAMALEVLQKTAAHRSPDEIAHLGKADNQVKQAAEYDSTHPYVGAKTSRMRESDRKWFERLGVSN